MSPEIVHLQYRGRSIYPPIHTLTDCRLTLGVSSPAFPTCTCPLGTEVLEKAQGGMI